MATDLMAYKSQILALQDGGIGQSLIAPPHTGALEFFQGIAQISTSSNTFHLYDDMIFSSIYDSHSSGTGSSAAIVPTIDNGHVGIYELQTGTTNSGSANVTPGPNGSAIILGGGNLYFETCFNIQTLATNGVDDYKVWIGVHDGWIFGTPPSNGLFFSYIVDTSPNWIINSSNGGVATSTTSSIVVATGWTRLGILYTVSGTIATYFINGVSAGTVNTNISSNPISPCWTVLKTAGTNNRIFYIDYLDIMIDFTTPR